MRAILSEGLRSATTSEFQVGISLCKCSSPSLLPRKLEVPKINAHIENESL